MIDMGRERVGEDLVCETLRDDSLTGRVLMTSLSMQFWPVFIKLCNKAAKRVLAGINESSTCDRNSSVIACIPETTVRC